jgi:hypothetical protein
VIDHCPPTTEVCLLDSFAFFLFLCLEIEVCITSVTCLRDGRACVRYESLPARRAPATVNDIFCFPQYFRMKTSFQLAKRRNILILTMQIFKGKKQGGCEVWDEQNSVLHSQVELLKIPEAVLDSF